MTLWPSHADYQQVWQTNPQATAAEGFPDPAGTDVPLPSDGWVLTVTDADYPRQLRVVPHPPLLLYGRGNAAALTAGVAVVGTRQVSAYGTVVAQIAAGAAGKARAPVISGLAAGCDTVAHTQALADGTPTVAVLASGVNHPRPQDNAALAVRILAAGGALVSEQPPGYAPAGRDRQYAAALVARNRIIVGLSATTVVCEAALGSGTAHSAWSTLAAGRPLLVALPRPAARSLPGAALPLMLADPRRRSAAELVSLGAPKPVAAAWEGRTPLASGAAEGREELAALVHAATILSPWHVGGEHGAGV